MKEKSLEEVILEVKKIREIGEKNTRRILFLSFLFISMGIALAYVFRNIHTESQYLTLLSLTSQLIAFIAAIMLSEQFLSIPEKYSGIHNHAIAVAMSAPIYIWFGGALYSFIAFPLDIPYSELWAKASTVICFGLGMVIFAFGSIEEAFSIEIKDKSAAMGLGWYMVIFSLGIQVYISLIELGIAP